MINYQLCPSSRLKPIGVRALSHCSPLSFLISCQSDSHFLLLLLSIFWLFHYLRRLMGTNNLEFYRRLCLADFCGWDPSWWVLQDKATVNRLSACNSSRSRFDQLTDRPPLSRESTWHRLVHLISIAESLLCIRALTWQSSIIWHPTWAILRLVDCSVHRDCLLQPLTHQPSVWQELRPELWHSFKVDTVVALIIPEVIY